MRFDRGPTPAILIQALENVANTFGGQSKTLLIALAKEIKRLQRAAERDEEAKREKAHQDALKEYKATGQWPKGWDDDIPF